MRRVISRLGSSLPAAHVVDLAGRARGEGGPDALAVVVHVDPVAHLHAVPVDRQLVPVEGVGDEQRDQLLGVLARAEGVGAAGDDGVEAVGAVPREHLEVAARLAGRVRAGRADRIGLPEGPGRDGAVDLVGRHLHEAAHLRAAGGLQQHRRADDVGVDEVGRLQDAAVHVALGGEVDHRVDPRDRARHRLGVGDVGVDEAVGLVVGDVGDVGRVAGVGELVEVHDLGSAAERQAHERGPDEPAATGHEKLHAVSLR